MPKIVILGLSCKKNDAKRMTVRNPHLKRDKNHTQVLLETIFAFYLSYSHEIQIYILLSNRYKMRDVFKIGISHTFSMHFPKIGSSLILFPSISHCKQQVIFPFSLPSYISSLPSSILRINNQLITCFSANNVVSLKGYRNRSTRVHRTVHWSR